ncbi:BTB/POZ domain-containing protein FBL11-like [Rutidosis leptorrhynchoides]|uniref:BTB/POZ domain-containing protein FBL11-like n=1 Tax=Rutidosis leptorrhynchoides TaxID=125765 RepID=UPI003A9A0D93
MAVSHGNDDVFMIINCVNHHDPNPNPNPNHHQSDDVIIISTSNVHNWNFSLILQHRSIKIKTHKNRLIEQSSYFHGLLSGNFSDPDVEVLVRWNQSTFLSLLALIFGSPVEVTSENFLSIFEGALYFGMDTILSDCKMWLIKTISDNKVPLIQLNDLVNIWEFGSENVNYLHELCTSYLAKNFMWTISQSSFGDVPLDLLLSTVKHPHLTVDSERHLCASLLAWIAANKQRYDEDTCINLLKQIRISLLPLWFTVGKNVYQSLSLLKQPFTYREDVFEDCDLLNLKIRLTEFSQKLDLSGCPQIKPTTLHLSALTYSPGIEPLLRKRIEQLVINHDHIAVKNAWEMCQMSTFEAVNEIDISNCPMLHLEVAIEWFSKLFPSLRTFKATNHLNFRTTKLLQLVKSCPLLCDINLAVDITPIIPTRVSVVSSFGSVDPSGPPLPVSWSSMSNSFPSNISKLTLDGQNDISDYALRSISDICRSLTYLSIRGCISMSDTGISYLICKCLKLNSIVACDTSFGQESILALCSSNAGCDHTSSEPNGKNVPRGSNLQMLYIGGCKGINMTCFSKLMSQTYKLKNLCLRETEVVDNCLLNFSGSSLEVLDVSNTKVSTAAVAHVIARNSGLKCLKARGCNNLHLLHESKTEGELFLDKNFYFDLGKSCCRLEEISVGWGFSYSSLEDLKPSVSLLKAIDVGLGGFLGYDGLKLLPSICPLLESIVLYFQVISDDLIVNLLESLRHLKSFVLCHCLGDTSSLIFKVSMPNLRKLRLERVSPWMNNDDLITLCQNCDNLTELSLVGCRLLNSESLKVISSGWPGLISIHLEECGEITSDGVAPLFDCRALEDVLLRHNGSGIQKCFIRDAVTKLPMLRKITLDICDSEDRDFDNPVFEDRQFLSYVKISRCKTPRRCTFNLQHVGGSRSAHKETLVLVWDSKHLTKTLVRERI